MADSLNDTAGYTTYGGVCMKTLARLERRLSNTLMSWQSMQEAWDKFHQTSAGRHVPRRVWMRHSAMLEVMRDKKV